MSESMEKFIASAAARIESARAARRNAEVTRPAPHPHEIRKLLEELDFEKTRSCDEAVDLCVDLITRWGVYCAHPRYFGWFNPTPTAASIVADLIASALNPQLAVWVKSPGPIAIEQFLVEQIGAEFGLPSTRGGAFTNGGTEANLTATILALTRALPSYVEHGIAAFEQRPVVYGSPETHKSVERVLRVAGLGSASLVSVTEHGLFLDPDALLRRIEKDRAAGRRPLMVVANAGSTNAGIIDPLAEIAAVCREHDVWFHVDAAWGGASAFSRRARELLHGAEHADSITFDPHKWLSAPLGTGMLLVRDRSELGRAFQVTAHYSNERRDPYVASLAWSRRFIGLRVLMMLLSESRAGIGARIDKQLALGDELRRLVSAHGWSVLNPTPLPVLCITRDELPPGSDASRYYPELAEQINQRGRVRVSATRVDGRPAMRVCICSHETELDDLSVLLEELAL